MTLYAYLVCECGAYGEQRPSTPEEEEKLRRMMDVLDPLYARSRRIPCAVCGKNMKLVWPDEFHRMQIRREMGLDD